MICIVEKAAMKLDHKTTKGFCCERQHSKMCTRKNIMGDKPRKARQLAFGRKGTKSSAPPLTGG